MKSKQHCLSISVLLTLWNKVKAFEDASAQSGLTAVIPAIIRVQEEEGVSSSLFQSVTLDYNERETPAVLLDVAQGVFFLIICPARGRYLAPFEAIMKKNEAELEMTMLV